MRIRPPYAAADGRNEGRQGPKPRWHARRNRPSGAETPRVRARAGPFTGAETPAIPPVRGAKPRVMAARGPQPCPRAHVGSRSAGRAPGGRNLSVAAFFLPGAETPSPTTPARSRQPRPGKPVSRRPIRGFGPRAPRRRQTDPPRPGLRESGRNPRLPQGVARRGSHTSAIRGRTRRQQGVSNAAKTPGAETPIPLGAETPMIICRNHVLGT